jgi:hypothetical protein
MKKTTITPINADQLLDWVARLDRNGCWYRLLQEADSGKIELFEIDAETILGIPKPKEQRKTKPVHIVSLLVGLALIVTLCTLGQPVPETEAPEITLEERYGDRSIWTAEYGAHIANNYLRNPRSYRTEDVRIIPIDQDSFVHVLIYSAVNDFNVRKEHSITSVVESTSGQVLRVVSQQ